MTEVSITDYITETFSKVETTTDSGYTFFFYRSERKLPFATIASSDNEHDKVSDLNRPGVFRLNIGVSKQTFQSLFGEAKIDPTGYDYTALDQLMPHPDYFAWHFICVLNPSEATMERVKAFLAEAYDLARIRAGDRNSPA
jgi:hypothetical protein